MRRYVFAKTQSRFDVLVVVLALAFLADALYLEMAITLIFGATIQIAFDGDWK